MIRKIVLTIGMACCSLAAQAQGPATGADSSAAPDYARIAAEVADAASPYYYPRLFGRYERGDTTLTPDEYRHLYYGYPTQRGYKPLLASPYADSLEQTFGKKTRLEAADYRRVAEFAREILRDEPFSMRDLNVLAFAYQMLDEPERAAIQMARIRGILAAICSTGTGLQEGSPWYVVYLRDAEDVLNLLGARFTKFIVMSRSVEFAPVYNMPDRKYKGYYFDYSEVYRRRPDYLDEQPKQKRRLEINPLYNPHSKQSVLPK